MHATGSRDMAFVFQVSRKVAIDKCGKEGWVGDKSNCLSILCETREKKLTLCA